MANINDLLLGSGLLAGSVLTDKEPGEAVEARQYLRNRFTSPTSISEGLATQVKGLQQHFDPLLEQKRNRALDEISQRYTAAFPGRVGAQPQEFKGYETYLRDQFVPGTQAFYGNLGLSALDSQERAARTILDTSKPDATSEALGKLAGIMLMSGLLGGQGGLKTGTSGAGGLLDQILGTGNGTGGTGGGGSGGGLQNLLSLGQNNATGPFGYLNNLLQGQGFTASGVGNLESLAPLFTGGDSLLKGLGLLEGAPGGAFATMSPQLGAQFTTSVSQALGQSVGAFEAGTGGAVSVLSESGAVIGQVGADGAITNAAGQAVGSAATAQTSGLTSFLGGTGGLMSGILGALGAGTAGYGVGNMVGGLIPDSRAGGTAAGAASGAAAGAIMGSVLPGIGTAIGAAIGALAGAFGGFGGSRGADHAFKAQRLSADMASQSNNVAKFGAFWTAALGEAGYADMDGWAGMVQKQITDTPGGASTYSAGGITLSDDQPNAMIRIGSQLLLKEIQKHSPQITSLDMVPDFRKGYIDYIMNNLKIESGGGVVPIQNIGQAGGYLTMAGLPGP